MIRIYDIYEDIENNRLFINKEGVINFTKKELCSYEHRSLNNIHFAESDGVIMKLIKENKGRKIFWKIRLTSGKESGCAIHTNWFLTEKKAKEFIINTMKIDYWFDRMQIDKYTLQGRIK